MKRLLIDALPAPGRGRRASGHSMLTENDVVSAVASHLQQGGWHIVSTRSTGETGHDILATKGGTTLAVEAKGGTSSKPGTRRYGKPFSPGQKLDHVAMALYKAASVASADQYRAGIALPSDDKHRKLIENIAFALEALNVAVFLVNDDLTVRFWPDGHTGPGDDAARGDVR